jgi:hypothetical protein
MLNCTQHLQIDIAHQRLSTLDSAYVPRNSATLPLENIGSIGLLIYDLSMMTDHAIY